MAVSMRSRRSVVVVKAITGQDLKPSQLLHIAPAPCLALPLPLRKILTKISGGSSVVDQQRMRYL